MKVNTAQLNFARGQLDRDLSGRYDLPIYQSGFELFKNFVTNYHGNAIFRTGFKYLETFKKCRFVVFSFNQSQTYLLLFSDKELRFMAFDENNNFGFVLDGNNNPLVITTPYSLSECYELDYDGITDVMYIVHPKYPPYKLTRTSANAFTFATYTRTSDPFTNTDNYPSVVTLHKTRLWMGATNSKINSLWGSKAGSYDDFTIPATVLDTSALSITLSETSEKILWIVGSGSVSIFAGCKNDVFAINGGTYDSAITANSVSATKTENYGASDVKPIKKETQMFYVDVDGRNLYYFNYDLLTEKYAAKDSNLISYDITRSKITKLAFKKDKNNILYGLRGDGKLLSFNSNIEENIAGWAISETKGKLLDIAIMYDKNDKMQLFLLSERTNGVFIEQVAEPVDFCIEEDFFTGDEKADRTAYQRKLMEELKGCNHLDCSITLTTEKSTTITFDGTDTITASASAFTSNDVNHNIVYKSVTGYEYGTFVITQFVSVTQVKVKMLSESVSSNSTSAWYLTVDKVTGLEHLNGLTVSLVGDGGYIDDYVVSNGIINLDRELSVVTVGLPYLGLLKTFNLGFVTQGVNTQNTPKTAFEVYLRLINSAGGKVGTSLYDMEEVQLFDPFGLYDAPPILINGDTEKILLKDCALAKKALFIQQDKPLPMTLTGISINADFVA